MRHKHITILISLLTMTTIIGQWFWSVGIQLVHIIYICVHIWYILCQFSLGLKCWRGLSALGEEELAQGALARCLNISTKYSFNKYLFRIFMLLSNFWILWNSSHWEPLTVAGTENILSFECVMLRKYYSTEYSFQISMLLPAPWIS